MSDDAAAARAQWRAGEDEWSRAALERWEHGRGLDDVLRDCMHRGDTVTFAFAAVTWSGVVVAVGHDVARVDTGETRVDVRIVADAPFVVRTRPDGADHVARGGALTTFLARLRELDGTPVGIGGASGPLEGELRVGRDQLRLTTRDGVAAYVPGRSVAWVRSLLDDD